MHYHPRKPGDTPDGTELPEVHEQLRPRGRATPSRARPSCPPRSGRRRSPAAWSSACRAPTPSSTSASRRSPAASCRTSPASTPSSRRPYVEDVRRCGEYDVAVLGAPFDGGTTYRSGTRFGPQGIRKISALYGPYSFELGVDLRESITIARPRRHLHDPRQHREDLRPDLQGRRATSTPPAPSRSCSAATTRSATRPSAASPSTCGGNLGIIHFDRHVDTQETDLDERMHTTPWFHATDIPNVPAEEPGADRHRRLAGAAARA